MNARQRDITITALAFLKGYVADDASMLEIFVEKFGISKDGSSAEQEIDKILDELTYYAGPPQDVVEQDTMSG